MSEPGYNGRRKLAPVLLELARAVGAARRARAAEQAFRATCFELRPTLDVHDRFFQKPDADMATLYRLDREAVAATGAVHKLVDRLIRYGE